MPKKILLTGGAGFIGSNLVRHLLETTDNEVVNVDKLTYAGNLNSLKDVADSARYQFEQVDLCDAAAVAALFTKHQPSAVMHLAAESHVDRSIDGPGDFIQTNIVGTYNLLQAALAYWRSLPEAGEDGRSDMEDGAASAEAMEDAPSGLNMEDRGQNPEEESLYPKSHLPSPISDLPSPNSHLPSPNSHLPTPISDLPYPATKSSFRFLHVSTDEVFGSLGADDPAFSESTPYDPHSPYSASKAASDHLVRAWHDTYGLPVLITNCSNNYGPYQFPEKLIPVVILKCLRGESIPVYGKGENIRDWLYVEDHCRALRTVLEKGRIGETYTIGGNNERQNIEIVKMLCRLMDEFMPKAESGKLKAENTDLRPPTSDLRHESLITFVSDRPGHDMRYAIDASKIRDELGWEPQEDFESGFRKTVQWYLANRDWTDAILSGDYKLERLGES